MSQKFIGIFFIRVSGKKYQDSSMGKTDVT
jgi:hypothetical protein